ncbi:MAG: DKNYY domain-containing protein [Saprospiraceae bacterium]|nr:DKNYY domain-containing protein [Saprospiraceae bacterium]
MFKILLLIFSGIVAIGLLVIIFFIGSLIYSALGMGYDKINKSLSDLYYSKDNKVYFVRGGNFFELGPTLIEDADLASLKILSANYALDMNNVYFQSEKLLFADTSSFSALDSYYAKDNNHVYYFGKPIPDIDPNTFEFIGTSYFSKDKNNVLYLGNKINNAIPEQFEVLSRGYAKDTNSLFYEDRAVSALNNLYIHQIEEGKDHSFIFLGSQLLLKGRKVLDLKNPSFFNIISDQYFSDSESVYHYSSDIKKLPNSDPATFKVLNDCYAKDKNQVYSSWQTILDLDPRNFRPIKLEPSYKYSTLQITPNTIKIVPNRKIERLSKSYTTHDNKIFFYYTIINHADIHSFEVLDQNYAKDKNNIYYDTNIIEGAIIEEFEIINKYFSKDKSHVFYGATKIEGCDPQSFSVLDEFYFSKDKNHVYYGNKIIEGISPTNFVPERGMYTEETSPGYVKLIRSGDTD